MQLFIFLSFLLALSAFVFINCGGDDSSSADCYEIAITISPEGAGTATLDPDSSCYHDSTVVTATAEADSGYAFGYWTGDVTFEGDADLLPEVEITVGTTDITLTAHFVTGYTVTVTDFPASSGVVQFDPELDYYAAGDTVSIEALADSDHEFRRWLVGSTYYDTNPLELVMDSADVEITVYYYTYEGEPECYTDYEDAYNGGCNSDPEVFQTIQSGESILGETGVYEYSASYHRDTDWYEYVTTANELLTWKVTSNYNLTLYIIYGTGGCDSLSILNSGDCNAGDTVMITEEVEPGTYWMWIGPYSSNDITTECGSTYTAWFNASSITVANMVKHEIDPNMLKAEKSE